MSQRGTDNLTFSPASSTNSNPILSMSRQPNVLTEEKIHVPLTVQTNERQTEELNQLESDDSLDDQLIVQPTEHQQDPPEQKSYMPDHNSFLGVIRHRPNPGSIRKKRTHSCTILLRPRFGSRRNPSHSENQHERSTL